MILYDRITIDERLEIKCGGHAALVQGAWGNKPAGVNREPLSLTTKGDVGLSRWSRRSAYKIRTVNNT
jgi:hypothetical protein